MTEYVRPLKIEELNTNGLTEDERKKLSQVLARNRQVASHENSRLNRLNREIRTDFSKYTEKEKSIPSEKCLVCSRDTGDFGGCEKCGKHVCRKCCLAYGSSEDVLLCKPCYKHMLLEAKAAKWFYDNQKNAPQDSSDSRTASTKRTNNQSSPSSKYEYQSEKGGEESMEMPTVLTAQHSAPSMPGYDPAKFEEIIGKMVEYNDEVNKNKKSSAPKRSTGSRDNYLGKDAIKATNIRGTNTDTVNLSKKDQKKCDEFVAKLVSLSKELKAKK